MSVERSEVTRIAALARLRFADAEVERLTTELNRILDHVEVLRDVAATEPDGAAPADDALAATRATEEGEPDALGAGPDGIAPRWADGFFVVPPPPGVHEEGS